MRKREGATTIDPDGGPVRGGGGVDPWGLATGSDPWTADGSSGADPWGSFIDPVEAGFIDG